MRFYGFQVRTQCPVFRTVDICVVPEVMRGSVVVACWLEVLQEALQATGVQWDPLHLGEPPESTPALVGVRVHLG